MDDVNNIHGIYGKGQGLYIPCLDGVVKRSIYLDVLGFCGIRHIVLRLIWGIAAIDVSS